MPEITTCKVTKQSDLSFLIISKIYLYDDKGECIDATIMSETSKDDKKEFTQTTRSTPQQIFELVENDDKTYLMSYFNEIHKFRNSRHEKELLKAASLLNVSFTGNFLAWLCS